MKAIHRKKKLLSGEVVSPASLTYVCDHCKRSILRQYPIQNYQTEDDLILHHISDAVEDKFEKDNPIYKKYYHINLSLSQFDIHQECLTDFMKKHEDKLKSGGRLVIDCMIERAYDVSKGERYD